MAAPSHVIAKVRTTENYRQTRARQEIENPDLVLFFFYISADIKLLV